MAQHQEIFEFFRELLTDMKDLGDHVIQPSDSFIELNLDSLDFVQIQVEVQKAYGMRIPTGQITDGSVSTLEQLAALIASQSEAPSTAAAA